MPKKTTATDGIMASLALFPSEPKLFIDKGIDAAHHSPIYRMHRYFARRPYNVFRYLIESYTKPGDIILDCFLGGGVTLVEGLATRRKVVAVDVNPLATFISDCQTTRVSINDYLKIMSEIVAAIRVFSDKYYSTRCRNCGKPAPVRWYELAYVAICPVCSQRTLLSNQMKSGRAGQYKCQSCGEEFASIKSKRAGYSLISVIYRCKCKQGRQSASPTPNDEDTLEYFEENFSALVKEHGLWFPKDKIPAEWDRQLEDGLHRRDIFSFSDLYTRRSLFFNAYLLKCFQNYRNNVQPDLYKMLIFTFSSILRYTNNMTFSASGWMDGRPVAWDKHAYWMPNQFVEVNPLEYIEKRRDAIVSGLKYQARYIQDIERTKTFDELVSSTGTHVLWTKSASELDVPDESIDAVITDPPYGHNVQYGELSSYWLVWLRNEKGLEPAAFSLEDEILVHRKARGLKRKNYDSYFLGLKEVFSECCRVLKPNGILTFTFNNKDIRAWYAVIKAAIKAGFFLDPRGVIYQSAIENYKNTSHTRYAGSLHGDFIYTFRKTKLAADKTGSSKEPLDLSTIETYVNDIAEIYIDEKGPSTTSELYAKIISVIIPILVKTAESDKDFIRLNSNLGLDKLDNILARHFVQDPTSKLWDRKS